MIASFADFSAGLRAAGFSMGSRNAEGIYAISDLYAPTIIEHTGDAATDPWEWRMRVLEEYDDIAYGKVFFRKSGWITREWFPYFLSVRRHCQSFEDAYFSGTVSHFAKRIYDCVRAQGRIPFHELKRLAGFAPEDQAGFERALIDLQMRLFITLCGRQQKTSPQAGSYGWASTVFCTTELFFGEDLFAREARLDGQVAYDRIAGQVMRLNPAAEPKKIDRFIRG